MSQTNSRRWLVIGVAALAAINVAGLGALMTDIGPWYYGLHKPSWQPPDWLFGPAWSVIFALCAVAGVLAWNRAADVATRGRIAGLFAVNMLLNLLWTVIFFRMQRPDLAVAEVVVLWLSIVALIIALAPASQLAALLLVPYLAWVSFAALLNLVVVRLNYPFQGA